MTTITDENGTREVSEAELDAIRAESNLLFAEFWQGLIWRPINLYDRMGHEDVVLVRGEEWAFGFHGPNPEYSAAGDDDPVGPAWRHTQDFRYGALLKFEPDHFAVVDDHWRDQLIQD